MKADSIRPKLGRNNIGRNDLEPKRPGLGNAAESLKRTILIKIRNEILFKSNENIHKKEGGSYYVVSANKASSVTL